MKVLLLSPPVEDFFFTPQRAYPLGILYLATVMREAGVSVKVINCPQEYKKKTLPVPREFSYLKRYYHPNESPFCLFSYFCRFGMSDAEIISEVRGFSPDIVGISANFSAYFAESLGLARLVKHIDKRIVVVIGGRVPTAIPQMALKSPFIDFVVRGEAEEAFPALCEAISRSKTPGIAGVCFKMPDGKMRVSKRIRIVEDLDSLPLLDRRFIDYSAYRFQGDISTSLLASRGCAMKCGFCAIREPFRYRSAENVFKEMQACYEMGIRHFNFEDDTINLNPEFEKILDMVIGHFRGGIRLSFMNGMLSLKMNRGLKEKLVKAGLTHIDLSIASLNQTLRAGLQRDENTAAVFRVVDFMAKQRIAPTVHTIIAFPRQDFSDAVKDIRGLAAKRLKLGLSIFYPVAESRMFQEYKHIFPDAREQYRFFRSSAACFDADMPRDKIFLLFYASRIINFVKDIIDNFSLKDTPGFQRLIREKTSRFFLNNNAFVSVQKLDRFTLGMLLLDRLSVEKRIYCVQLLGKKGAWQYQLKAEEFALSADIKRCLSGIRIRGLCGAVVTLE